MQDALIKALRARHHIRDVANLRAWLMRIASRASLDVLRAGRRERTRVERMREVGDAEECSMSPPLDGQDQERDHAALRDCLAELEDDTRAAFLMRHEDEAPWEQIAEDLDFEVDAIRMRVKRAFQGLRACLEAKGVDR